MDLRELKKQQLFEHIGFNPAEYSRVVAFIDFANMNRWYDDETVDLDDLPLGDLQRMEIALERLYEFLQFFTIDARFYYGFDRTNKGSLAFIRAAEYIFGKHRVFTKPIQQIRHDLSSADSVTNTRLVHRDGQGDYVLIPKCNFDVEIAVDAMRLINNYGTICLLSGDSDFAALLGYLKTRGKKTILIKGGRITHALGKSVDLKIEAATVKPYSPI